MPGTEREVSNRQKVYQYVKNAIISQEFSPGAVIHERELAHMLGVSRTPVREALQTLQNDGWLTILPRKGSVVRPLSRAEMEEVLQLRIIIGTAGIKLSIGRISVGAFAHLKGLVAQQEAAAEVEDYARFIEVDMQLHLAMVHLAGNRKLSCIAEELLDTFRRVAIEAIRGKRELADLLAEHKAIIAALEREDQATAESILIEHIGSARQTLFPLPPHDQSALLNS